MDLEIYVTAIDIFMNYALTNLMLLLYISHRLTNQLSNAQNYSIAQILRIQNIYTQESAAYRSFPSQPNRPSVKSRINQLFVISLLNTQVR